MRKALTFTIASLFTISLTTPANAAAKAGGICTTVNATTKVKNQTLKCTKVGKKLLWKAIPTKPSTPQAGPVNALPNSGSPCERYLDFVTDGTNTLVCLHVGGGNLRFNRPTTPLTPDATKAYNSIRTVLAAAAPSQANLTYYLSPTAPQSRLDRLKRELQLATDFWAAQYQQRSELPNLVLTEKDREWFIETLKKVGANQSQVDEIIRNYDRVIAQRGDMTLSASAWKRDGLFVNYYILGSRPGAGDNAGWFSSTVHEWTHNAQYEIAGELPCWFREGQPVYYGLAITAKNEQEFREVRREFFRGGYDISTVPEGGWESWLDSRSTDYAQTQCGSNGAYEVGGIVTEYMLTLKGHQGVVDYMVATKTDGWQRAFVTVYGMSWAEFKTKASEYIRKFS